MKTRLLVVVMIALVAGFGFAEGQAEEGGPVELTWSSASVPDDAHTKAMFEFEKVVEEVSDGEIQVEVSHSGELYTQEESKTALRRGTLEMNYTGPNWLADQVPYMSMFAAPYIFDSYEHMTETFNGPIGEEIFDDIAEEIGIRPLGAYYLGTRQLNLRDIGREVTTPEDMEGVKLRMPDTPSWQFMGRALGANPTPVSFTEVYLSLQTGTIDGQDNPLPTNRNAKFYEVTEYIVLTDHFINPIMPTINEEVWQSLTDQQKEWVMEGVDAGRELADQLNLEQEEELVQFFEDEGLTIIEPDKEAFKEHALDMTMDNEEMTSSWDMELFEEVQALGEELK